MKVNIKKLAVSAMLTAVAVSLSGFSIFKIRDAAS